MLLLQSKSISKPSSILFFVFTVLIFQIWIASAQVYSVEYDYSSSGQCTETPLRTWSYANAPGCTQYTGGVGRFNGNQYVKVDCNFLGSILISYCTVSNCSGVCSGSVFGATPGACFQNARYYCTNPPPTSVLVPDPNVRRDFMQYSEFMDASCTKPYYMNPFNQTKITCYQRNKGIMERAQCVEGGTSVDFTYWKVDGISTSPICDMSGVESKTTRVNVGDCVQDPNLVAGTTRYIKVHRCTSGAASKRVTFFGFIGLLILSTSIAAMFGLF